MGKLVEPLSAAIGKAQAAVSVPTAVKATAAMTIRRSGRGPPSRAVTASRSSAMQAALCAIESTSTATNPAIWGSGALIAKTDTSRGQAAEIMYRPQRK